MDRYTIAGVLDKVKDFYNLDDAMAGLIQTLFVVSYMITAPVFGYLGDRYNRTYIVAAGITFWSITTLLGSFIPANKFGWFLFMRAMVGVGEASYSTIAPTIIADLLVEAHRARGLAFFYFAIPLGSGAGYMVGDSVTKALGGWQWSLRVTPGLGLLSVVATLMLLHNPRRGDAEGSQLQSPSSLCQDLLDLAHNRTLIWNVLGFSCVSFAIGALAWWGPILMKQALPLYDPEDKLNKSQVDLIFGGIACASGFLGVLMGGLLSPQLKKFQARADAYICSLAILGSSPLIALSLFYAHKNPNITWSLIFFGQVFLSMCWSPVTDILLTVVVPNQRSLAEAVHIMVSHLLGDAASPYIVGVLSTAQQSANSTALQEYLALQRSLYLMPVLLVVGGLFFLVTSWYFDRDLTKCTIAMGTNNTTALPAPPPLAQEKTEALFPACSTIHLVDLKHTRDHW